MASIDLDYARRLEIEQMSNNELFQCYDNELVLRLHSAKNLRDTRTINPGAKRRECTKDFCQKHADEEKWDKKKKTVQQDIVLDVL